MVIFELNDLNLNDERVSNRLQKMPGVNLLIIVIS